MGKVVLLGHFLLGKKRHNLYFDSAKRKNLVNGRVSQCSLFLLCMCRG